VLKSVTETKAIFGEAAGALEDLLDLQDEADSTGHWGRGRGGRGSYNRGHWDMDSGDSGDSGNSVEKVVVPALHAIPEQPSADKADTDSNGNGSPQDSGIELTGAGAASSSPRSLGPGTGTGAVGAGAGAVGAGAAVTEPTLAAFTRGPKQPLHPYNVRILRRATAGLDSTDKHLSALAGEVSAMLGQIQNVQHEPELWYRKFPANSYTKLVHRFDKLRRSGQALSSGARSFSAVLCQMLERGQRIGLHLSHFRFMLSHLFAISSMAQTALSLAREALER
jgi:hypothetical protein